MVNGTLLNFGKRYEDNLRAGLLGITSYSKQDPEMALAFMLCSTTTKMLYQILGNK